MRRRSAQLSAALIALAAIVLLAGQGIASEAGDSSDPARLMGRLRDLVRQLRERRQEYYQQKTQADAEIEAARRNRELLERQAEELREEEALLDAELASCQLQIRELEGQLSEQDVMRQAVDRAVASFVAEQVRQIEVGIPYRQQERTARVQAARIDPNVATAALVADRMGLLWSYAQEELRLAESSETYSERAVAGDATVPHARYFRVGQLLLGYVTEDGGQAAMWLDAPEGGQWQVIADPKQLAHLRDAAEVLDRRQAPRFVSLPIVLGVSDMDEKGP